MPEGPGQAAGTDVFEIMHTMRAMRRLKPDPVPDELINKILAGRAMGALRRQHPALAFPRGQGPRGQEEGAGLLQAAFDEIVGPRYASSPPPPGSDPERYKRQHAAVKYLTDHYHEAPVWIVACLEDGENPGRTAGSSIYGAVQNMCLAAGHSVSARR